MTSARAFELAYRIDHEGEAIVYSGATQQAEDIASKLAGGGLRVAVQ
jgi:ATP-dependent Clp protease adaptor protein ClpS